MLNREDMLELTRRITPDRHTFTRVAGAYIDFEGDIEGSFNVNFLNLKGNERRMQLEIAKAIPFSETNKELLEYKVSSGLPGNKEIFRLFDGMITSGLKNDALMETFYELVGEKFVCEDEDFGVFVYHNRYDIPRKGRDGAYQGESEEVYEFLICAFCPLYDEFDPGLPTCGFLYPSFKDRSRDLEHVAVFHSKGEEPHLELEREILNLIR